MSEACTFAHRIGEVREFRAAEEVGRAGKRGAPAAVDEHRVPTDVVGVEVGAEDGVDAVAVEARGFEIVQEGQLEVAPEFDGKRFVVADAGIYDDAAAFGFDDEGLDGGDGLAFGRDEMREKPGDLAAIFGGGFGNDEAESGGLEFDDAGDADGADLPVQEIFNHAVPVHLIEGMRGGPLRLRPLRLYP